MSWLTPIKKYLQDGEALEDKFEHNRLRTGTTRYTLINGELCRHSFTFLYLKCLTEDEVEYALNKVHEGVYRNYLRVRTIAYKLL